MILAKWPAPLNVKAYTTTRLGGVSTRPFGNNNLGLHVGDCEKSVALNRDRLNAVLPNNIVWPQQTHSINVCELNKSVSEFPTPTDAIFTTSINQICCIMTADCLPILVTNSTGTQVAAIHAGWRGLAGGIIENTIAKFDDAPSDIIIWLGPAIGPAHFEVGQDVFDIFMEVDSAHNAAFVQNGDKYLANIYQLARNTLNRLGICNISGGHHCTYEEQTHFFSYRRDGQTGRMASIIWIAD